jgi:hypothetical protein
MRPVLILFLAVGLCQVQVNFEMVRYNDETLTRDQLVSAFDSLGLKEPSNYHLRTMDLNAVLLFGQCEPGWYWAATRCLECQCLVRTPTSELSLWFEVLRF